MIGLASFATPVKSMAIETTRKTENLETWPVWPDKDLMSYDSYEHVGSKFIVLHLMYVITCHVKLIFLCVKIVKRTQVTQTLLNLRSRCRLRLLFMSLSLIHQRSMSFVAYSWLSCRRFKAMSLVGIYPNRATDKGCRLIILRLEKYLFLFLHFLG